MLLKVSPDLSEVIRVAQEAQIEILEMEFLRSTQADFLEAILILVDGREECKQYFSWLLDKGNLCSETVC